MTLVSTLVLNWYLLCTSEIMNSLAPSNYGFWLTAASKRADVVANHLKLDLSQLLILAIFLESTNFSYKINQAFLFPLCLSLCQQKAGRKSWAFLVNTFGNFVSFCQSIFSWPLFFIPLLTNTTPILHLRKLKKIFFSMRLESALSLPQYFM